MPPKSDRTILLDARAMSRALQRMAVEVAELAHGPADLVLIGIQRRGVELADFGRPKRISLCVLVDRGGRELPIQADVIGKAVKTGPGDRVDVQVEELDGRDQVELVR